MLTRREMLHVAGAGAAALVLAPWDRVAAQDKQAGPFTLPELPYKYDALEPSIDKETMTIHHDKHHKAYVDNLNKAIAGNAELAKMPIEAILRSIDKVPMDVRQAVINNGGGHANHALFWEVMGPKGGGMPAGALAKALDGKFRSFDNFKKEMSQKAVTRFGSGWAWLVVGKDGELDVISTANQDSPLMTGQTPILGLDVWEHAYYLKYQNLRPKYVEAWWNVVNWSNVSDRYAKAKK